MSISYSGGKLPFVMFSDQGWEDRFEVAYSEKIDSFKGKNFHKEKFPYENDWTVKFDGPTIDDIYMAYTLEKGDHVVYYGDLSTSGDEIFFCAKNKASLEAFKADFEVEGEINKNLKVVQAA